MKHHSLILLVSAAFALGACGGGDSNDNASNSTTGTTGASGTSGTTGTTGTTKNEKTDTTATTKTGTSGSKTTNGGPKTANDKGSTGKSGTGSKGGGAQQKTSGQNVAAAPKDAYGNMKAVCGKKLYLPYLTQEELKRKKKTVEEIARTYSKSWPKKKRSDAYRGCLAGLRARARK